MLKRISLKKEKADIYAARPSAKFHTKFSRESPISAISYGNPFINGVNGMTSIETYAKYIRQEYIDNTDIQRAIDKLIKLEESDKEFTLGCFCDMDKPCHVDELIKFVKEKVNSGE